MQASQSPTLVPLAFAANGTKNTIPEASQIGITPGAASLNDGFPPLTFTPIAAGGVPPAGADFNGILYLITQSIRWQHAGGQYGYNSAFANDTNVGGYPRGAMLLRGDLTGLWLNQTDNNTANPDTGGANWVSFSPFGSATQTFNVANATAQTHALPLRQATGRLLNVQKWTTHGTFTYTPTPGTTAAYAECQGAGGSGGGTAATGSSQCAVGGGGGSGAFCSSWLPTGIASGTIITVGQGGAQANGGSNNGGSSSIGSIMTAPGGNGGTIAAPTTAPWLTGGGRGATGSASGGNLLNTSGQGGDTSFALTSGSALVGGAGASSVYGGGGGVVGGNTAGFAGVAPGSGGSGAATGASQASIAGGPGADGAVYIYEYGTI